MANEMENYAIEYLDEHDILNDTEELICYYDVTTSLDGTEAAILTSERVLYLNNGITTSMDLQEVSDTAHTYESFVGDVIEIRSHSGKIMKILIAPLNSGPSFYSAVLFQLELVRNTIEESEE